MALRTDEKGTPAPTRRIGALGTAARVAVGMVIVGSVVEGHLSGTFRPAPWVLGLLGLPAVTLAWHGWTVRRSPERLQADGVVGHLLGLGVFLALYLTWWYAPPLDVTSDAALLFYGASMLLAATTGSPGCEVLAFSNWVLNRTDEVGCALFQPVDHLGRQHDGSPPALAEPNTSARLPKRHEPLGMTPTDTTWWTPAATSCASAEHRSEPSERPAGVR